MKAAIFTGSRDWLDRLVVSQVFDDLQPDVIIEGGADGLDTIAKWEAIERGVYVITFLAEWGKYGRSAGPMRNRKMLDKLLNFRDRSYDISVQAFPLNTSRGTFGMMKMAENENVPVFTYKTKRKGHRMTAYRMKT